jgi:hypothetical protein
LPAAGGGPDQTRARGAGSGPIETKPGSVVQRSGSTADRERAWTDMTTARGLRAQSRPEAPSGAEGRPTQTRTPDNPAPADAKPAAEISPAAPARRPAAATPDRERGSKDTPARGAQPQRRDSDTDAADGSAIIDWLLNESGRR